MEFTILKSASEKSRGKRNGSGSHRSSLTNYNSKSLERPKRVKGNEASSSSGTAAVVQSLSGKSVSSGLNEMDNDTDSVGTCDSDEGMLEQGRSTPRTMSLDPYYNRVPVVQMRLRSATASGTGAGVTRPHARIVQDDFSLNRNSAFAESYRFAVANNSMTRTGSADNPTKRMHQCKAAVDEILNTERTYVLGLNDVLKGYRDPLNVRMHELPISVEDAKILFAEIREIRDFNRGLLEAVERCGYDMKEVGECFLQTWSKQEGCQLYSQYCTKYPLAVEVYAKCVDNATMLEFFKKCQHEIRHALPLGSDLLEPVQRVLRYHILLQKILHNLQEGEHGYEEIKAAHGTMTGVAEQINEMKRQHETAVHVHEVQSQLQGWVGNDLTTYGELTLEDSFKYYSGRGTNIPFRGTEDRHVFLFQQLILLTKKREEAYKYKGHIEWTDLQLIETLEHHPNSFQVKQLSTGTIHTFHPRTDMVKQQWIKAIKKMIVESIPEISRRIPPNLKDLLLKGARKSDLTADNISGDFRHKSTSMQGLNEISGEGSPRSSSSRLALSVTAKSPRTMAKMMVQGPVSADDSRLPYRRSSSSERVHYSKDDDGDAREVDSGIVYEQSHASLSHSKSAGLSGRSSGEKQSQMYRNLSDSQILDKSRSPTDKDSLYSSDSVGSLDQADLSDLDQGRVRGSSPSTDFSMSDLPVPDGLTSGTRTRSSGRRKKVRPTSFTESDNIPEHDILLRSASPSSDIFSKSESVSAEPPAMLDQHDGAVSQNSLFPDSLFASLESQWGDSLLTEVMQKTDKGFQSSNGSTRAPPCDVQSGAATYLPGAMHSTMSAAVPPPGMITRGQNTDVPRPKLTKKESNELGSELQEDRYWQLRGSLTRRHTLDQDLETTYLDDQLLSLPPPMEGITEDPLPAQEASEGSFPILSPPDKFSSKSNTDLQSTAMPPAKEAFVAHVASPGLNADAITRLDVPPCEVAVLHSNTTTDNETGTSAQPPTSRTWMPISSAIMSESSDSLVAVSDKGGSSVVSPSPNGSSMELELPTGKGTRLSSSTPVTRRLIADSDKRRPLSLCSVDSQSSDGSPSVARRRFLVSMVKSESANIIQPAEACPDLRSAMLSGSCDETTVSPQPNASVQDTGNSSDAESRKDSVYSLQSAEISFDSETTVTTDTQEMTIDEILPILDEAAGKIMTDNTSVPSSNSSISVPSIVVESVCSEVKRHSKTSSAKMSPLRRHTTPDMAAALEAESKANMKVKSPGTKVKKIARDYSRRIRDGKQKFSRFQSFTSPTGYTALDSPEFPRKPVFQPELSIIHHTLSGSELGNSPKPPRPPWLEEAKRVRELRKLQPSPSASSLDSAASAPSHVIVSVMAPTESQGNDLTVSEAAERTVEQSKLVLESVSSQVSAKPLPSDNEMDKQIRPRMSLSPSDHSVGGDLFAMRELSRSTDAIPRSLSTSDVKTARAHRRGNRSSSAKRASVSGEMMIAHEVDQPKLAGNNFEEIRHRGGFRGFVKNLVDKFGGRH